MVSAHARALLERLLRTPAWWSTSHHLGLGGVFEAREPGGRGARWAQEGQRLVGLLEPFDSEREAGREGGRGAGREGARF
ncbi:MAG: hypothetical protein FJ138_00585 [Deltaproteobacteria bacterium]|nr:hypothetical protein [Deltaproteobacteria bacterium]